MSPQTSPIPLLQLRPGPQFNKRAPRPTPASIPLPQFTEFYCQSGGSNLNGGSDNSNSAKFTSTNGNWSTVTNTFTPTDGTNPWAAGVTTDQDASIYVDGATVSVYIARIIGVQNAANGVITVSSTAIAGAAPTTSATGRSIKVGGAWLGPNAASGFPFTLAGLGGAQNSSTKQVRVNLKNDQTYTMTASFAYTTTGLALVTQGYSSRPADGGKATFDGTTNTAGIISDSGVTANIFLDLIFATSFASATTNLIVDPRGCFWTRCVFKGARLNGFINNTAPSFLAECEAYNCNLSNTASAGGIKIVIPGSQAVRCVSHDNTGTNTSGFVTGSSVILQNCISAHNDQFGINAISNTGNVFIGNCDIYNNGSDGIRIATALTGTFWIENCNLIQNRGAGINNLSGSLGFSYNNGYSDNAVIDTLGNLYESGKVVYPSATTPWVNPANGDFSINLAAAIGVGRGAFTETQSYTAPNTIGYPDIGAAQAQAITQSFTTTGTQTLPYGYLGGHAYTWKWGFSAPVTVSVVSGSLPTGLILVQATPTSIYITGTPTVAAVYDFTLRATSGTSTGDANFEITILSDPDEGIGGLLGGLRPTC